MPEQTALLKPDTALKLRYRPRLILAVHHAAFSSDEQLLAIVGEAETIDLFNVGSLHAVSFLSPSSSRTYKRNDGKKKGSSNFSFPKPFFAGHGKGFAYMFMDQTNISHESKKTNVIVNSPAFRSYRKLKACGI